MWIVYRSCLFPIERMEYRLYVPGRKQIFPPSSGKQASPISKYLICPMVYHLCHSFFTSLYSFLIPLMTNESKGYFPNTL